MATGGEGPKGIDVSKWQTATPSLAGLSFLFARASIGTKRDEMYATHIRNARRAGLLVGAYHFNHEPLSVRSQVDTFLAAAGDVDFYALDVEGRDAFTPAQTKAFIAAVQATGRKCGLYMSEGQFWDAGQDFHWVANWSQEPRRAWDFWQWQGSPLDRNTFNGTLAELRALAAPEDKDMKFIKAVTPGKLLRLPAGTDLYDFSGTRETETPATPATRDYPLIGSGDAVAGTNVILVPTGAVYADSVTRPTYLLAKGGTIVDAPVVVPPPDTTPFTQEQLDAARAVARGEGVAEGTATEKSRLRKLLGV